MHLTPILRSYPPAWKGQLLLACRKCQKKLKGEPGLRSLAKLKRTIKRHNKNHPDRRLHLINVSCMNMCPKRAVTICLPASYPASLSLLRDEREIDELFGIVTPPAI